MAQLIGGLTIFNIDSRNRSSGTLTDFEIRLENFPLENDFNRVCLLNLSIAKTYYLIDSDNNTFTLTEGGTDATVTLTLGNYSLDSLATELAADLTSASPNGYTYTCAGDTSTGKYTISVASPASQPSLTFGEDIGGILGFGADTYAFSGDTVTSPNVVRLQKTDGILVWTDLCAENEGILHQVFATQEDFNHITYEAIAIDWYSKKLSNKNLASAHFRILTYEAPRSVLDLNGHHVHMVIGFWQKSETAAAKLFQTRLSGTRQILGLDPSSRILEKLDLILQELQSKNRNQTSKPESAANLPTKRPRLVRQNADAGRRGQDLVSGGAAANRKAL